MGQRVTSKQVIRKGAAYDTRTISAIVQPRSQDDEATDQVTRAEPTIVPPKRLGQGEPIALPQVDRVRSDATRTLPGRLLIDVLAVADLKIVTSVALVVDEIDDAVVALSIRYRSSYPASFATTCGRGCAARRHSLHNSPAINFVPRRDSSLPQKA